MSKIVLKEMKIFVVYHFIFYEIKKGKSIETSLF